MTHGNQTLGNEKRLYLDYAAATPLAPAVFDAMLPYFSETFGNAGGIHSEGVAAKVVLEAARSQVARTLSIQDSGVVFTSGGTESNNLAIVGTVERLVATGRAYEDIAIVSTKLEHPATLKTLEGLDARGVTIIYAPVTEAGQVDMKQFASVLTPAVVMVTVAYVNSEVGAINHVRDIRRELDRYSKTAGERILLHVDAAQAPLWLPCDLTRLGADLLSLDGGKCCGPKGVGVLALLKGVTVAPLLRGGGQEMGVRPGTEPLPLVVGMATALTLAQQEWQERAATVSAVRDYALNKIVKVLPAAIINGPVGDGRVANNIHISIPGLDAEFAVISLDVAGIACSTKSACSSKGGGASTVVLAMTGDEARALSTLRFTLGPDATTADIDRCFETLLMHIAANLK